MPVTTRRDDRDGESRNWTSQDMQESNQSCRSSGAISAGRSCWSMARFSRGNFLKRPRDTRGTMGTRDTTRQKTTGDATRHARDLEKMGPLAGTFHELLSKCGKFWRHKSTFRPPTSSTNTLSRAQ